MSTAKDLSRQFENDFLAGQLACQNGEPCPAGASNAFIRGYGAEYERQQISNEMDGRLWKSR